MKIELKNIEHFESMSEETFCFSANLYVDGKKIGAVSNRGHGGCHEYDFDMETVRQLNQWCKENLPKWSMDDQEYETDLELHISNLVADFLERRFMNTVSITDFTGRELEYLADMIHEKLLEMGYGKTMDGRHLLDGTFDFNLIVSFEEA